MCCFLLLQAFVVVGDSNGHVGLGVKCAKEVGTVSCGKQKRSAWIIAACGRTLRLVNKSRSTLDRDDWG